MLEQGFRVDAIAGIDADADARRDVQVPIDQVNGFFEQFADPLRDRRSILGDIDFR